MNVRSWATSIPIITRPESVPIRPWDWRALRTMSVLDNDTSDPNQTDSVQPKPSQRASGTPSTIVAITCSGAPTIATRRTGRRSDRDSSSPRPNSSRVTPISARRSRFCGSPTVMPPVCGPTTMPARR